MHRSTTGRSRAGSRFRLTVFLGLILLALAVVVGVQAAATPINGESFTSVSRFQRIDPSKITIAASMYLYAFRDFNFGLGFAAAVIAALITTLIAVVYLKALYREVEY